MDSNLTDDDRDLIASRLQIAIDAHFQIMKVLYEIQKVFAGAEK
jgi:hypothetical protein